MAPPRLLTLPTEIRLQIYELCFSSTCIIPHTMECPCRPPPYRRALLRKKTVDTDMLKTNKQINREATPVFLKQAIFLTGYCGCWPRCPSKRMLPRVLPENFNVTLPRSISFNNISALQWLIFEKRFKIHSVAIEPTSGNSNLRGFVATVGWGSHDASVLYMSTLTSSGEPETWMYRNERGSISQVAIKGGDKESTDALVAYLLSTKLYGRLDVQVVKE